MPSRTKKTIKSNDLDAKLRNQLLLAFLAEVPFAGWSDAAFEAALKKSSVPVGKANLLLPEGLRDMTRYFGAWVDDAMTTRIARDPRFRTKRTRDKVAFAVMARLDAQQPHREAYRKLLAWYARPQHLPLALRRLYQTVDLVWREAGDTATDFNFYTKRGLLAGVVKATTLFWLTDETPNQQATREFLDRRISEVLRIGKTISLAKEWSPQEWLTMARDRLKRAAG